MPTPAVSAAVAEPMSFPFAEPPPSGSVREVVPGLFWLRMPLPFALNHINLWLLRDGNGWTAIDCGIGLDETRAHWETILREVVGSVGLTRVLVTHYHPDHFGNANWLTTRFNAPLWMTETEYLTAQAQFRTLPGFGSDVTATFFTEHGLDAARASAVGARGNSYSRIVGEPPLQFTRMLDGDDIDIGGNAWRVIGGYGHSPEHAALYCKALGALISGDMLLPKISTNVSVPSNKPDSDPLHLFLRSIDRFKDLPNPTLILPSHGLPFRGAQHRVQMLHDHHRDRLAEVLDACARPSSAADLLPVLFRRELDTHQIFFAMGESIAHLNYLWLQGRLARDRDSSGILRFLKKAA